MYQYNDDGRPKSTTPPSAPLYQHPIPPAYSTYPVIQAPIWGSAAPRAGQWTTGLCGCCEDPGNCCTTFWCPCIVFGQNAEIIDRNSISCCSAGLIWFLFAWCLGCPCCYSCTFRTKLRGQFSLPESPCGDCLVHCFCEYCAICQEYRELKNRGLDPSIGWVANADKMNQGVAMVPPAVMQGMPR